MKIFEDGPPPTCGAAGPCGSWPTGTSGAAALRSIPTPGLGENINKSFSFFINIFNAPNE